MTDALLVSDTVWTHLGAEITRIAPGLEVILYEGTEPLDDAALSRVTLAFFSADTWPDRSRGIVLSILKAPNLRWLQTFSAGVDSPFFIDLMNRGVRLSTASGATASPIAQTVVMYMLALSRDLVRYVPTVRSAFGSGRPLSRWLFYSRSMRWLLRLFWSFILSLLVVPMARVCLLGAECWSGVSYSFHDGPWA
ncbi:MAG: hypothetical protein ACKOQ1_07830, partial [Actinomycetota bacterium]